MFYERYQVSSFPTFLKFTFFPQFFNHLFFEHSISLNTLARQAKRNKLDKMKLGILLDF